MIKFKFFAGYKKGFTPLEKLYSGRGKDSKQGKSSTEEYSVRKNSLTGFTLVEIMFAVGIIALILGVAIPNYLNAQRRARATRILGQFQEIEQALYLLAYEQERSTWWLEGDFGQGGNPTITSLVANTQLGDFLMKAPTPPIEGAVYKYDNDGDTYAGVFGAGVGLILGPIEEVYFLWLDKIVDDSDGRVQGKITYRSSDQLIIYRLADNSEDF